MTTTRPRARDLGVPFDGTPAAWNAITDVVGVEVGHATLISGRHDDPVGGPAVRTGVTAIHPLGKDAVEGACAGWFALNGTGEMTGTTFVDEHRPGVRTDRADQHAGGGVAHQASIAWSADRVQDETALLARATPIVGETWDGDLNDIRGFHVRARHVREALESAATGPVSEGSIGGGTGMTSYDLKAGIGTASRAVETRTGAYTLGVLVQANYGRRHQLRIAGVPVGDALPAPMPSRRGPKRGDGSIVVIVATDAPLLPNQAKAIARRAGLGLARNGSIAANTSGDLFLAFSTANRHAYGAEAEGSFAYVPTERIDPLFAATVDATEEAIVNALVAADEMTGAHGTWFPPLPHEALRDLLRTHGRLVEPPER